MYVIVVKDYVSISNMCRASTSHFKTISPLFENLNLDNKKKRFVNIVEKNSIQQIIGLNIARTYYKQ